MIKLLTLVSVYAIYLILLFYNKKKATLRAIAAMLTIGAILISAFLFVGGLFFSGSVITALSIALIICALLTTMIWAPYYFRLKHLENQ
jgi:hypothetical protein